MLMLKDLYEARKVTKGESTFLNYVVPFVLNSGEKWMLDFSSGAKNAIRADGHDFRGKVGPFLAIEVDRAVEYAHFVETHALNKNAFRFTTRHGYIIKVDPD